MGTAMRLDDRLMAEFMKASPKEREEIERIALTLPTTNGERLLRKLDQLKNERS